MSGRAGWDSVHLRPSLPHVILLERLRDILRGLARQTSFREQDLVVLEQLHVDAGATPFIIAEFE